MTPPVVQADSIDAISSEEFLRTIVGDIRTLEREPMKSIGFSGTRFERLHLTLADGHRTTLVLKHVDPRQDATVWRTGNVPAREARLLSERALDGIWDVFDSPYLAYAFDGEISALLMRDLAEHLFPDVREPIRVEQENALIDRLAALHATYWEHDARHVPWLAKAEFVYGFTALSELEMEEARGRSSPFFAIAREGWEAARQLLTAPLWNLITTPPEVLSRVTEGLPRTIVHGDAKVANFAVLTDGRVSAFDWATIGEGCAANEMGFYIAVNASRLTRRKEALMTDYRNALEQRLDDRLPDSLWTRMWTAGILGGAAALLWTKALNVKHGRPGADAEWSWWTDELEARRTSLLARIG